MYTCLRLHFKTTKTKKSKIFFKNLLKYKCNVKFVRNINFYICSSNNNLKAYTHITFFLFS